MQGVQFVGIDVRDNDAAATARAPVQDHVPQHHHCGGLGKHCWRSVRCFLATPFPAPSSLTEKGRVAARVVGRTTYVTLHTLVADAVAERQDRTSTQ